MKSSDRLFFSDVIQGSYTKTLQWLSSDTGTEYRKVPLTAYGNPNYPKMQKETTLASAAQQFYVYFPTHYFKFLYTLKNILGDEKIFRWVDQDPNVCLIDVGCGGGAASAAFVDRIIELKKAGRIYHPVNIFLTAVDVNKMAMPIYNYFISNLIERSKLLGIYISYQLIPKGLNEAPVLISSILQKQKQKVNKPFLPHLILMHSNVISPLSDTFKKDETDRHQLITLGISEDDLASYQDFGIEEAEGYKHVFESIPVDHLVSVTIDTKDDYLPSIEKFSKEITRVFQNSRHRTSSLISASKFNCSYINPSGCYFLSEKQVHRYTAKDFYVDILECTNVNLHGDTAWRKIFNLENLKLAWARVRKNNCSETLCDDVELFIFENQLDDNLLRLQRQAFAYVDDIAKKNDRLNYSFPKNISTTRTKTLSRIEEEILLVSLIQATQEKFSWRNKYFAYNLNSQNEESEYLYQKYYKGYLEFINASCSAAKKYVDGVVIRLDIKSYYTEIVQDLLLKKILKADSEGDFSQRFEWLLLRLITDISSVDPMKAKGIPQGSAGSGFLSNEYLREFDLKFNDKRIGYDFSFFRYVDDMIFVLPRKDYVNEVQALVSQELAKLKLELNTDKTEVLSTRSWVTRNLRDASLSQLSREYNFLIDQLFSFDFESQIPLRKKFEKDQDWWIFIKQYQRILQSTGIYLDESYMSRKLSRKIFDPSKNFSSRSQNVSPFLRRYGHSLKDFSSNGCIDPSWQVSKDSLKKRISDSFLASHAVVCRGEDVEQENLKQSLKSLRFLSRLLCTLGFNLVIEALEDSLTNRPWVFRKNIHPILEALGRQGYSSIIENILMQP